MSEEKLTSELIVTGKQNYGESSLIVNALSPDFGKLDFIIRGARKQGVKHYGCIDICSLYEFSFKFREAGLIPVYSYELAADFSGIGANYELFAAVGGLLNFVNGNCQPMIPQPGTFACLGNILLRAAAGCGRSEFLMFEVTLMLTFLYENGFLPDALDADEEVSNRKYMKIIEIIQSGESRFENMVRINAAGWEALRQWANSLLTYHGLKGLSLNS